MDKNFFLVARGLSFPMKLTSVIKKIKGKTFIQKNISIIKDFIIYLFVKPSYIFTFKIINNIDIKIKKEGKIEL